MIAEPKMGDFVTVEGANGKASRSLYLSPMGSLKGYCYTAHITPLGIFVFPTAIHQVAPHYTTGYCNCTVEITDEMQQAYSSQDLVLFANLVDAARAQQKREKLAQLEESASYRPFARHA